MRRQAFEIPQERNKDSRKKRMKLKKIKQLLLVPGFLVAKIVSFFYKKKTIFLIMERGNDARDNGFCFFEYVQDKHPEIESYYAISKDSSDRKKLNRYGKNIIDYGSFQHYLMYCRASHIIDTHIHGYNKHIKRLHLNSGQKHIFLQHGIMMNYIPDFCYSNTLADLVISGAKPEYYFLKSAFGYPDGVVRYTGLCRFDKLCDATSKKQILLMPTWRKWLTKTNLSGSEYFNAFTGLLSDPRTHELLTRHQVNLVFYPHHEMQPYLDFFKSFNCENITIASKYEYDVQTLLKESSLLITDYSSVFFDFTYMHKPTIYYQFDRAAFRKGHYQEGYFSYDDGLGPVAFDSNALLRYIEEYCENGFRMNDSYAKKADEFFVYRDSKNCERVFNSIIEL